MAPGVGEAGVLPGTEAGGRDVMCGGTLAAGLRLVFALRELMELVFALLSDRW